ncbi:MAG: hypothetical protein KGL39_32635 [Patescibacteria group bacterium]|nr:hypothetical protein [Patescibacteria group bacterium]
MNLPSQCPECSSFMLPVHFGDCSRPKIASRLESLGYYEWADRVRMGGEPPPASGVGSIERQDMAETEKGA